MRDKSLSKKKMPKEAYFESLGEFFSLKRQLTKKRNSNRVLMYHSVGGETILDRFGIFDVPIGLFHDHIKSLVDQEDIVFVDSLNMNISSRSEIAITFDDGYLDNSKNAAPTLARYGIPFTVFVSTKFISDKVQNFLTPTDLRVLSDFPGAKIGSHGVLHIGDLQIAKVMSCFRS